MSGVFPLSVLHSASPERVFVIEACIKGAAAAFHGTEDDIRNVWTGIDIYVIERIFHRKLAQSVRENFVLSATS
jgi:hypothetical protein